ncbi:hypothetical protein [Kribbella qitaiheensis]|uniref:hypothetical protein n=1 Tax=Kribbella qitaiheensis TaxID=1544730 RepID=UPI001FEC0C82|nr:hypothetical protein [Kribbella qitaiheensis]
MLVRRTQVGVADAELEPGEEFTGLGPIHRREPGSRGLVDRREFRRDLRTGVGLLRAREDRDRVGEEPAGCFWRGLSSRGAGGMNRGQQRGGGDEGQQAATSDLHWYSRAKGKNLT